MPKFYVCCAWHDFPEDGTYTTTVQAKDHAEALELCHREMADSYAESYDRDPEEVYSDNASSWDEIDCYKVEDSQEGQILAAILTAWDQPYFGDVEAKIDQLFPEIEKARKHIYG